MTRLLALLAVLFAAATGAAFLADNPGTVSYAWRGRTGTLSTTSAAALALGAMLALLILWEIVRAVWRLPRTLGERRERRRRERSAAAVGTAVVAVGAGDIKQAKRAAQDLLAASPDTPMAAFIAAQAAQLSGDRAEAERHFRTLLDQPETRALGLRGLAVEAERAGEPDAALEHVRAALSLDPALPWAADMAFSAAAASGDFEAALAQLEINAKAKLINKAAARRLRAVLLTASALARPDEKAGQQAALEAHNLEKEFVPAALAASAATAKKSPKQAAAILSETYKRTPHPDLFRAALDLVAGSAADKLSRAKALSALRPDHPESAMGLARAALAARDGALARETMAPQIIGEPTQRACILMAEIEALAPGDEARVRHWLARAVRAPKDPVWIADGVTAASWAPISPVTGKLDAFEWRVPPSLGDPPSFSVDVQALMPMVASDPPPAVPQVNLNAGDGPDGVGESEK